MRNYQRRRKGMGVAVYPTLKVKTGEVTTETVTSGSFSSLSVSGKIVLPVNSGGVTPVRGQIWISGSGIYFSSGTGVFTVWPS